MPTSHKKTQEKSTSTMAGGFLLILAIAGFFLAAWMGFQGIMTGESGGDGMLVAAYIIGAAVVILASILILSGLYSLQQNESAAITLFGNYKGTDKRPGLRWVIPWYSRKKISLRVRNVTSETLKVNDKKGNPIEIAAVIVWRVVDTAQALFDVDDYDTFVNIQVETSLREITSHFAYDHGEGDEPTLRADGVKVGEMLQARLNERVDVAGVTIDEARISHLAYAPEIASSMLRRQQAAPRSASQDRARRGVDGGKRAAAAVGARHRGPRRRAQGCDGVQPSGRALRRSRGPAHRQCGLALLDPTRGRRVHAIARQESISTAARSGAPRRDRASCCAGAALRERRDRVPAA